MSYTISQTKDKRVTFIDPAIRLGFALSVRSALRIAETPYVWIQQHDWAISEDIPIEPLLDIMEAYHEDATMPIKYVCFPTGRLREHEGLDHVTRFPALRQLMLSHRGDFSPLTQPDVRIPLTPLFFWHDKPHVVSTAHYLARIFPSRLAMPRGSFIEDTVGHRAREQMKNGNWTKWACWLYYPNQGKTACMKHLNGRTWKGIDFFHGVEGFSAGQQRRAGEGKTASRASRQRSRASKRADVGNAAAVEDEEKVRWRCS